jgi:hypothetical protein
MKVEPGQELGFISRWFGFGGWRAMSLKTRIFTQIIYRFIFLLGLAIPIIGYGMVTGSDPGGLTLLGMMVGWFLIFQAMINFVFVEGSR